MLRASTAEPREADAWVQRIVDTMRDELVVALLDYGVRCDDGQRFEMLEFDDRDADLFVKMKAIKAEPCCFVARMALLEDAIDDGVLKAAKLVCISLCSEHSPIVQHMTATPAIGVTQVAVGGTGSGSAAPNGIPVTKEVVYLFVLVMACTMSGGVILGLGSFAGRALREGILDDVGIAIVFNVGFQLLTWLSLVWSLLHDSLGPRCCAVLGLATAASGNLTIALALGARLREPYVYAIGYGMIGGGGNGAYISAFHFTALFTRGRAVRVALLSCAFNAAGYAYMLLNSYTLALDAFFWAYFAYASLLLLAAAAVYPDAPYKTGDVPMLTRPCSGGGGGGGGGRRPPRAPCASVLRAAIESMRIAAPELRTWRYWGFCLSFSWGALTNQWAAGAQGSGEIVAMVGQAGGNATITPAERAASERYLTWAVPAITNATFLVSPLLGRLIDRTGFYYAALLLAADAQLTIGLVWAGGAAALWASLAANCLLASCTYTLQFTYLTLAFPPAAYPGLLTVTLTVQGTLGFIAWGLTLRPFGCVLCPPNFLVLLLPSLLMYLWPLLLLRGDAGGRVASRRGATPAEREGEAASKPGGRRGAGGEVTPSTLLDRAQPTSDQPAQGL